MKSSTCVLSVLLVAIMAGMIGSTAANSCPCFSEQDLIDQQSSIHSFANGRVRDSGIGNHRTTWSMQFNSNRRFETADVTHTCCSANSPTQRSFTCKVQVNRPCSLSGGPGFCALNTPPNFGVEDSRTISESEHRACMSVLQDYWHVSPTTSEELEEFDEAWNGAMIRLRNGETNRYLSIAENDQGRQVLTTATSGNLSAQFTLHETECEGSSENNGRPCVTLQNVAYPQTYLSTNGAYTLAENFVDGNEPHILAQFQLQPLVCERDMAVCNTELLVSWYGDRLVSTDPNKVEGVAQPLRVMHGNNNDPYAEWIMEMV